MDEHDDDLEANVEEDAEFETLGFPTLEDDLEDDEAATESGEEPAQAEEDIDPDKSEI